MQEGGGEEWVLNMKGKGRDDVRQQLMTLSGVGPKVGRRQFSLFCIRGTRLAL